MLNKEGSDMSTDESHKDIHAWTCYFTGELAAFMCNNKLELLSFLGTTLLNNNCKKLPHSLIQNAPFTHVWLQNLQPQHLFHAGIQKLPVLTLHC